MIYLKVQLDACESVACESVASMKVPVDKESQKIVINTPVGTRFVLLCQIPNGNCEIHIGGDFSGKEGLVEFVKRITHPNVVDRLISDSLQRQKL